MWTFFTWGKRDKFRKAGKKNSTELDGKDKVWQVLIRGGIRTHDFRLRRSCS